MASYLSWERRNIAAGAEGYLRIEIKEMLACPRWNLPCRQLHAAVSLDYNTYDGVHTAAIYMLLFPVGYPQMEPTEEMGYRGWNLLKSRPTSDWILTAAIYMLIFPLCYPHGASRGDGLPWMESRLKPRTAAMYGKGICRIYCDISFYNNMWPFYIII